MRIVITALLLLSCCAVAKADKPLTPSEKQAVAKYDDLPVEWKDRAIKAWRNAMLSARCDKDRLKTLLKNEPAYFPPMYESNVAITGLKLSKGDWGTLNQRVGLSTGIYVDTIISKTSVLCRAAECWFVIDGVDTSALKKSSMHDVQGTFIVDGTETRVGNRTVLVLKPLPKKQIVKSEK